MAKKRKAGGQPFGHRDPEVISNGKSKLIIKDWQDVADSEDEFHIGRDKVLLEEGPAHKKLRKAQEESKDHKLKKFQESR